MINIASIHDFYNLLQNNSVIIYYSRRFSEKILHYVKENGFLGKVLCIAVDRVEEKPNDILGKNLIPLRNLVHIREKIILIIEADNYQCDIAKHIHSEGFDNIVCLSNNLTHKIISSANSAIKKDDINEIKYEIHNIRRYVEEQNEVCSVNEEAFKKFKGINSGKSLAIIGTGPSLDLYKPKDDIVYIGMNGAWRRKDIKWTYYFAQDFNRSTGGHEDFIKNTVCDYFFIGRYPQRFELCKYFEAPVEYSKSDKVYPYFLDVNPSRDIYMDITHHPLFNQGSIVFPVLQFALYTQPKKIYLIGCDVCNIGYSYDKEARGCHGADGWKIGYARLKTFAEYYYPDVEIISVNPIGLKKLFKDEYTYSENVLMEIEKINKKLINNDDKKMYSKECLLRYIDAHEVISFDVFDTLLMRKTLYPDQIFEIMEDRAKKYGIDLPGFVHSRKIAEAPLWSGKFQFKDIYKRLQDMLRLSDDQRDWLMNLEINTEKSCIIPRHDIVDAFNYAKAQGKYIVLVTDMYHSKEIITEFLEGIGVTGYDEIFISAEYGCSKTTGLFVELKKSVGERKILHIGDNYQADGKPANDNGIDSFLVDSSRDILAKTPFKSILDQANNSNELSLLGLIAADLYNSPFSLNDGKTIIDSRRKMVFSFIAPLATGFLLWIKNKVKKGIYDGILFSARDCYVMQQMYHILEKYELSSETKSMYFFTSRKAAALTCEDDDLIRKIFPEHNSKEIIEGGVDRKKCRNNYIKYLKKAGIRKNGKYALVDLSSRGTAQYFVQELCDFNMVGLYLRRLNYRPIVSVNSEAYIYRKDFSAFYNVILESTFTADHPSVERFSDNGDPILSNKKLSEENRNYLKEAHKYILEFFEDYISNVYIDDYYINSNNCLNGFMLLGNDNMVIKKEIIERVYIDDGDKKFYITQFLPQKETNKVEKKIPSLNKVNNSNTVNKAVGHYHCFPFKDIVQNSQIIIYGMGEVGRHYLKQIHLTGYCKVVCATDGNWSNINDVNVKMVSPDEAVKLGKTIVIANGNINVADDIKKKLVGLGVLEDNIVWNDMIISEEMVTEELVGNTNKKLGHYHIFPFADIAKDEKVIIWGMGEVGRHYTKQLQRTGYAEISYAVDANWQNAKNTPVMTVSPDILKSKVNAKIVIANGNEAVAQEIRQQLQDWGYSEKQILWNDKIVSENLVVQPIATSTKSILAPAPQSKLISPSQTVVPTTAKKDSSNNNNVRIKAPTDKLKEVLEQVLKSSREIEIEFK